MSLSLSANRNADRNVLAGSDMLFAVVLHILVITLAVIINWWQSSHEPEPLKRIEVRMISGAELKKLQHPPRPAARPKPKPKPKPSAKPALKAAQKAPAKPAEDENFDPFAPMESSSDRTEPTTQPAGGGDLATLMGKQLSAQEKERYKAQMQNAIEKKWKVSADYANAKPVQVKLHLRYGGHIVSVKLIGSTGYPALDDALKRAIYAAAPFDFLPKDRARFEPFIENTITARPEKRVEF